MKSLLLISIFTTLSAFGGESFFCHNQQFLDSGFDLTINDGSWSIDTENGRCDLFSGNGSSFVPMDQDNGSCFLRNLSRRDVERRILLLEVGPNGIERNSYLKVSLDNSFADYGPRTLTTFLYCR